MRREPTLDAPGALVAARCDGVGAAAGNGAPAGNILIVFAPDGQSRRVAGGQGLKPGKDDVAWWFDPGPHVLTLVPFAAAPEVGLHLDVVIDSADPRLARQRFDLFLFSEVAGQAGSLLLAALAGRIEGALRAALEQGTLELPPCTSLDEWNAFRAGLNELLYTRFGLTVDDCLPVELEAVDFADLLRRRAAALAEAAEAAEAAQSAEFGQLADAIGSTHAPIPHVLSDITPAHANDTDAPAGDARALRRLFLELPEVTRTLRLLPAPSFAVRQALLQQLALAALDVNTMPALAWAAPGQPRAAGDQRALARASTAAVYALDELWAVLANLKIAAGGDEEVGRVVANLACHLAARRGVPAARDL
jgi:hypothetical protein